VDIQQVPISEIEDPQSHADHEQKSTSALRVTETDDETNSGQGDGHCLKSELL